MWVTILNTCIYCTFLTVIHIRSVQCHIPSFITTPANKIEQYCDLSESCVHDTIPVCGRMGDEKKTFLDLCDMLEFACDTNQIYSHIDDEEGCPRERHMT